MSPWVVISKGKTGKARDLGRQNSCSIVAADIMPTPWADRPSSRYSCSATHCTDCSSAQQKPLGKKSLAFHGCPRCQFARIESGIDILVSMDVAQVDAGALAIHSASSCASVLLATVHEFYGTQLIAGLLTSSTKASHARLGVRVEGFAGHHKGVRPLSATARLRDFGLASFSIFYRRQMQA